MASHAAAAAAPKPLSTSDILAGNASEEVNHQAQFFGSLLHSLTELILLIIPPAVFTRWNTRDQNCCTYHSSECSPHQHGCPRLAIGVGQPALQRWGFICVIVLPHFLQPDTYFVHKQAELFSWNTSWEVYILFFFFFVYQIVWPDWFTQINYVFGLFSEC